MRNRFVFKIVPMLNPAGVILGNYRTGLAGLLPAPCSLLPPPSSLLSPVFSFITPLLPPLPPHSTLPCSLPVTAGSCTYPDLPRCDSLPLVTFPVSPAPLSLLVSSRSSCLVFSPCLSVCSFFIFSSLLSSQQRQVTISTEGTWKHRG